MKPIATQPPLPIPTSGATLFNLAGFDQDLVKALSLYLSGMALRLNNSLTADGEVAMKAPIATFATTVALLPAVAVAGAVAFATNGRKNGEGVGAGTGVLVFHDGTNWIASDSGQAVAA